MIQEGRGHAHIQLLLVDGSAPHVARVPVHEPQIRERIPGEQVHVAHLLRHVQEQNRLHRVHSAVPPSPGLLG